jgi:ABC-type transporter Mla maintaining outer membrane lipid asymmetry ATPase subunit MlaF
MMREPIISIKGLRNRFGEQIVHNGLNLDVQTGEIIGIVGGSGTGKSVLMRSILGLQPYEAGEIKRPRRARLEEFAKTIWCVVPKRRAVFFIERDREC